MGDGQPHLALDKLVWPSNYETYHSLSRRLIDSTTTAVRGLSLQEDAGAAVRAKTYDIVTDLAFITRLALDIANARRANQVLSYDPKASPMLAFLLTGGDPAQAPIPRIWHHPIDLRLRTRARKSARRMRSRLNAVRIGAERIDVHNRNNLTNTVLDNDSRDAVDWPVTDIDWQSGGDVPAVLKEAMFELGNSYKSTVSEPIDDTNLANILSALGYRLIAYHLAKSWCDLQTFERYLTSRPMGAMLLGGTPKHLGRIAGWLYRRTGRSVVRCAHGGERVFFNDYEWGLAEFPDCDVYYAHSAGERDAIARRYKSHKMALVDSGPELAFKTLGSPHHKALLERSRERTLREQTGTVVYVAGGYLGEQLGDFPNRKPPDILYLDWQVDLIRALKMLGYRVAVKPHPAGIGRTPRYLAHYADTMLEGLFDPMNVSADAFVFDFAGTAFFDSLATNIPVVLADMGVRPLDPTTRDDLSARCVIVPAHQDERGRFRVARDSLGGALTRAKEIDPCPPGFHDRYFGM